jgi:hypothetical protein
MPPRRRTQWVSLRGTFPGSPLTASALAEHHNQQSGNGDREGERGRQGSLWWPPSLLAAPQCAGSTSSSKVSPPSPPHRNQDHDPICKRKIPPRTIAMHVSARYKFFPVSLRQLHLLRPHPHIMQPHPLRTPQLTLPLSALHRAASHAIRT